MMQQHAHEAGTGIPKGLAYAGLQLLTVREGLGCLLQGTGRWRKWMKTLTKQLLFCHKAGQLLAHFQLHKGWPMDCRCRQPWGEGVLLNSRCWKPKESCFCTQVLFEGFPLRHLAGQPEWKGATTPSLFKWDTQICHFALSPGFWEGAHPCSQAPSGNRNTQDASLK